MQDGNAVPGPDAHTLARQYKDRLLRDTDLEALIRLPDDQKRARITALLEQMFWQDRLILAEADRARLIQCVLDETVGLGPLEALMHDPAVTEIMVVRPDEIYFEKDGRIRRAEGIRFTSCAHLLHIIERIIAPLGRRIDEASPLVDARLPDGSRVHAAIPPVVLNGPVLTIRRFRPVP